MKKILILTVCLTAGLFVYDLQAQTATPAANTRQMNQTARIAHGMANGELTKREARALKAEQRHIRRTKRRAKADGVVTAEEKLRINRKQRRANRHIRRQKHDAEKRY